MEAGSTGAGRADVVGRVAERRAVERLLAGDGPRALVLDGEAGIGKSTVWLAALDLAGQAGQRILRCQPAQTEATLPFVGLGDLLEPVLAETRERLPEPQRDALDVALLRAQPVESHGRLAVSKAVLATLREAAARDRIVLAIDDVQWLDPASAEVLEFALRRLADAPVRVVVTRRSRQVEPAPLGLTRAFGAERVEQHRVGPLSVDELDALLRAALDLRLARPRLIELRRRTDGNPLFALEIARAAARADGDDWAVPDTLGGLLRDRLEALPAAARDIILLAAAASQPTIELLERAAPESGTAAAGLAAAIRGEVLLATGARIRFSHPLLASVAYESALPNARRAAHRRLADAVEDLEERGRHLALATVEPDEAIALELERATVLASRRGAPESAASLAEHAARLTPADRPEDRRRRLADAAEHHIESGDPTRGRTLLAELVRDTPPGPVRANLLWRQADAGGMDLDESIRLTEQALTEAGDDPAVRAEIRTALGVFTWIRGDFAASSDHTREAVIEAERAGDEILVAISLGELCHVDVVLGRPLDEAAMARALEIEARREGIAPYLRPSFQLGVIRMYTDQLDAARPLLEEEVRRIDAAGDESARCGGLFRLAELELRAGAWGRAATYARDALAIALQAAIEQEQGVGRMIHGAVQAHIGNLDEARQAAEAALATTGGLDRVVAIRSMGILGFIELSAGDAAAALRWLDPAMAELRSVGIGELSVSQVAHNQIEALVATGRLAEAEDTIGYVAEKGRLADRAWHAVVAARGRGLVAAARGDMDEARGHIGRALEAHARLPQPFELGRTLLAQGTIERRAKRRGEARQALIKALEVFDTVGAGRWAERAAAELARIPGRPGAGAADRLGSGVADGADRDAPPALTETERRVAELAASGLSNKEVAAQLFISVRTVEANLSKVYAKLGVRSRTELARSFAPRPPSALRAAGGIESTDESGRVGRSET